MFVSKRVKLLTSLEALRLPESFPDFQWITIPAFKFSAETDMIAEPFTSHLSGGVAAYDDGYPCVTVVNENFTLLLRNVSSSTIETANQYRDTGTWATYPSASKVYISLHKCISSGRYGCGAHALTRQKSGA